MMASETAEHVRPSLQRLLERHPLAQTQNSIEPPCLTPIEEDPEPDLDPEEPQEDELLTLLQTVRA
jgi:hypothetical protein